MLQILSAEMLELANAGTFLKQVYIAPVYPLNYRVRV
jgi:hypothetical protein